MTEFDFTELEVRGTARAIYSLFQLSCPPDTLDRNGKELKHPKLELAPATDATPRYWEKILALSGKNAKRLRGGRIDAGMLEETEEQDRRLYPLHIIKGWQGVFNTDGQEVPFDAKRCAEFVKALPGWIFRDVRDFASEPMNFLPEDSMSEEEATEAGNV